MKAIMKTIKPKTCANIMNLIQSILVIKNKREAAAIQNLIDENGYAEIYVCCSKDKKHKLEYCDIDNGYWSANDGGDYYNGKVVFKFRCYKVAEPITTGKGNNKRTRLSVRLVKTYTISQKITNKYIQHHFSCLCWSVRGHLRHYKSGKVVFVKPFRKGRERGNFAKYKAKEYNV